MNEVHINEQELIIRLIEEVRAEVEIITENSEPKLTHTQQIYLRMCLLQEAFELHRLQ